MSHQKGALDLRQTQRAIHEIKKSFQANLAAALNLTRVSAPLVVPAGLGLNDDLNGVERPIGFEPAGLPGQRLEIVQSLAKWKRLALARYGFELGEGLYTDMNALRPDEVLDETHSMYVDQWDWERVISTQERCLDFLFHVVRRIYAVIREAQERVAKDYPALEPTLPREITLVSTAHLEERYPELSPRRREDLFCEQHGACFVIGIGAPLKSGEPHDGRAPDYDDWSTPTPLGAGLNGDIIVWSPILRRSLELSSMGIRVDSAALERQLALRGVVERRDLEFHRRLLAGELPQSIGGGIGQSRLCMFLLRKAHIGEVQCGVWPTQAAGVEDGPVLL